MLIVSKEARAKYAELKRRNADLANRNMDSYVDAKASFVAELLTRARRDRNLPSVEYYTPDLSEYGFSGSESLTNE